MNGYLKDNSGNSSSKRLWGTIIFIIAIIFSIVLFVFSLTSGAKDSVTALSIINIFFITGGGLLGLGVLEKKVK